MTYQKKRSGLVDQGQGSLRNDYLLKIVKDFLEKVRCCLSVERMDYESASTYFHDAAKYYSKAEAWYEAGAAYVASANCKQIMNMVDLAVYSYADAAWCYKHIDVDETISCLEQAQYLCLKIKDKRMIAWCYKKLAETYETNQYTEQAMIYYERAASIYQSTNMTNRALFCQRNIAKLAALLKQYSKAVEIFLMLSYMETKERSYGYKEHLLNAGICQLCEGMGETAHMKDTLKEYEESNSSFSGTQEYRLLANLVDAIDHQEIAKFVDAEMRFSIATMKLDSWRATLLSRAQKAIKQ